MKLENLHRLIPKIPCVSFTKHCNFNTVEKINFSKNKINAILESNS